MSDEKVWKRWCRTFHWLRGTPKRSRCSLCPGFQSKVWKKSQLIQHERSKVHSTSAGRCCCPDAEAFRQMFDERNNGTSLRKSKHGLSKSVKLMWVSNEAIKEIVKARVQRCLTASLSQDGQGSSLGVRMTVVSFAKGEERLITTNSPLAFLKSELSGSHNLAKASRKASRRFFTKRLCPPHGWIGMKPLIYARRTTPKPKKNAESFLLSINEEAILQMAMMCDAAQEELDLIRFCDKNTVDVSQMRAAMDGFMNRINTLFLKQKALQVQSYTRHVVAECFSRMSQWVSLAEETLKAEWPSFEAIQAFSVFQLTPRLETAVVKRDLGKISQVFQEKHNLPALVKSFADCEYTAAKRRQRIADDEDFPDLKAWVSTLQGRQAADNPELVKCLARALCLSQASTSACERDFGNILGTFRKRGANPLLKEMHVRITSFLKMEPGQSSEIIRRAQQIWKEGFNSERKSGSQRGGNFVSGTALARKRQAADPNQSQSAWVKRRRLEVDRVTSLSSAGHQEHEDPILCKEAKDAIKKIQNVVTKRRFEAQQMGILQKHEPTFLWTTNTDVKKDVAMMGAHIVESWQEATCHVVDNFAAPGQRVSWAAKLSGHLIVTKDLAQGPWIQNLV
ncbi:unnamed protein product [Cladocopium goreaui]|uniref:Uncharacterized protein n=1 Tax=Cladocopium goreaui TaxID=2562237 RepID=A0A9P1DK28_9DINO|nr:unnamed protein product [Cladocopium goreaui]CAI4014018.1 unnamed protein product [Cladocopium goreaui]